MAHDATAATRGERASKLFASAQARLERSEHVQRQLALGEMQDAALLDPTRPDIAVALGRLDLEFDFLSRARDVARRAIAADSSYSPAWLLSGEVWKRYWLTTIDEDARDRAIMAHRPQRPARSEERARVAAAAPLLVDAGEPEAAYAVAVSAARAAPRDPQAQALLAASAQRIGDLSIAQQLFDVAVPRLPVQQRERYEDISSLLPAAATESFEHMTGDARMQFIDRFWADTDPDPVSPENEAKLEYFTRVTQALNLYGTSRLGEWDMRAQYYVRFGRPSGRS